MKRAYKKQTPWVWTPEAAEKIEQARARGLSNRSIAKIAGCSPQNIDQVFARIRMAREPMQTVKLTDDQRREQKTALRDLVCGATGISVTDV